jgi:hypothetical protein
MMLLFSQVHVIAASGRSSVRKDPERMRRRRWRRKVCD